MNDESPSREELIRQIAGQVQSLRLAGVEWLPATAPLNWPNSAPLPAPERKPAAAPQPKIPAFLAPPPVLAVEEAVPAEIIREVVDEKDLEERRQALQVLANEIKGCSKCAALCSTRTQTVFGSGKPGVELCFVGEAPGADEDAQGMPFVGAAGQLLTKIIEACGLKREEVYICNILKCRPPNNRTPLPDEAANCRDFLDRQLRLVRPKFICALGGCAATNLLKTNVPIGKLRGKFHDYEGIPVLVTYHPAYLLPHRSPGRKKDVWEDMKMLLKRMGRPIPSKGA